jgi:rhodanese-related sulfurtransferase
MKLIPTLLALALFTTLASADEVKHVQSKEAAELIAKGNIIVLDVRTPDEYAEGAKLDKSKTYLVHCQAGGRSTKSLEPLQALGFEHLIHLDDGFGGWKDANLPIKK